MIPSNYNFSFSIILLIFLILCFLIDIIFLIQRMKNQYFLFILIVFLSRCFLLNIIFLIRKTNELFLINHFCLVFNQLKFVILQHYMILKTFIFLMKHFNFFYQEYFNILHWLFFYLFGLLLEKSEDFLYDLLSKKFQGLFQMILG